MNNSVFDTIAMLVEKGLTEREAIAEVESKLRMPLPEEIKDRVQDHLKMLALNKDFAYRKELSDFNSMKEASRIK